MSCHFKTWVFVTLHIFSLWIAKIQLKVSGLASLYNLPGFYFGTILLRVWFLMVMAGIIQMPCLFIIYAVMDVIRSLLSVNWKSDFNRVRQYIFKCRMCPLLRRVYHSSPLLIRAARSVILYHLSVVIVKYWSLLTQYLKAPKSSHWFTSEICCSGYKLWLINVYCQLVARSSILDDFWFRRNEQKTTSLIYKENSTSDLSSTGSRTSSTPMQDIPNIKNSWRLLVGT